MSIVSYQYWKKGDQVYYFSIECSYFIYSLGHVVLNANRIWTHAIVRDCSRYLERAIIELSSIEDEFRLIEKGQLIIISLSLCYLLY